jgi:hypothetical protein
MHILQNIHLVSIETMGQNRDFNYKGKGEIISLDFIPIITTKQERKYVALKRYLEQYILEYSKTKITSDIKQILKTLLVQHLSFCICLTLFVGTLLYSTSYQLSKYAVLKLVTIHINNGNNFATMYFSVRMTEYLQELSFH